MKKRIIFHIFIWSLKNVRQAIRYEKNTKKEIVGPTLIYSLHRLSWCGRSYFIDLADKFVRILRSGVVLKMVPPSCHSCLWLCCTIPWEILQRQGAPCFLIRGKEASNHQTQRTSPSHWGVGYSETQNRV